MSEPITEQELEDIRAGWQAGILTDEDAGRLIAEVRALQAENARLQSPREQQQQARSAAAMEDLTRRLARDTYWRNVLHVAGHALGGFYSQQSVAGATLGNIVQDAMALVDHIDRQRAAEEGEER